MAPMSGCHRVSRGAALAFVSLTIFPFLLSGQDDPCLRRSFVVTVADEHGKPVTGLDVANFRADFGGKPVRIVSVEPDLSRRRVVVLLDQSGSMTSRDQVSLFVNDLAARVVTNVAQPGMVALMTFSIRPEPVAGFGTPSEEIIRRIRSLQSSLMYSLTCPPPLYHFLS